MSHFTRFRGSCTATQNKRLYRVWLDFGFLLFSKNDIGQQKNRTRGIPAPAQQLYSSTNTPYWALACAVNHHYGVHVVRVATKLLFAVVVTSEFFCSEMFMTKTHLGKNYCSFVRHAFGIHSYKHLRPRGRMRVSTQKPIRRR